MISVDNLSILFGDHQIFKNISFVINSKDKIGLVGKNGAGKTTLLRVFMGLQQPDTGKTVISSDIRLGYLPQQMEVKDNTSLFEEAGSAFDEILILEKEISHLNQEISNHDDYESPQYIDLLEQLYEKTERFHLLEGSNREQKIEQILTGLGFNRNDFNRPTSEFSGGWRMRIELAKILLKSPDVVLLDEPTNHLDIDSIQWLENFLNDYHGAVVLISHDRVFLDKVTKRTLEISLGNIYDYKVPFSKYVILRKERREQQLAAYKNQQKTIEETRDFIERFRYKATKAVQVQSRIKMLEKLDIIEVDEEDVSAIKINFPPAPRAGIVVLKINELSAGYEHQKVLDRINLTIQRGEKTAFMGRNGEGKSTLTKVITGMLHYTGHLKIGHNVHIGYFAQNQDELLDSNKTIYETLDEVAVGEIRTKIRDIMGAFMFKGDEVDKKVKVLSGGERSRVAMAKLLLEPYNLLILDEPTNHMDMRSKDILKKALLAYDGTLIAVSHDRDFLDGLVTKVYEFRNKKVKEYLGGIYEFLAKKNPVSMDIDSEGKLTLDNIKGNKTAKSKQAFENKKAYDRQVRKLESQILETEERIEETEKNILEFEQRISDYSGDDHQIETNEFYSAYEVLKKDHKDYMWQWEKLYNELEQLKNKRI